MTIKPMRNGDDLTKVIRRLEKIFQAEERTARADERDVLVAVVEAYENEHYDFGPADPVEAITFRMDQEGLTPRDLEPFIGPSGRVAEVLNRKRPLGLRMVKILHEGLKTPLRESAGRGVLSRPQISMTAFSRCIGIDDSGACGHPSVALPTGYACALKAPPTGIVARALHALTPLPA